LSVPTTLVCCYPGEEGFIEALAALTSWGLVKARSTAPQAKCRVLFSAHGLPKKVVARGDPYPQHVEETAARVATKLGLAGGDWIVCYQSRVGPLQWISPATDSEIRRAGAEGVAVVVVPVAFVSEHSETLVELDIEYAHLAKQASVPCYVRVPTVSTSAPFIQGLARLVRAAAGSGEAVRSQDGPRRCFSHQRCCPAPQG